MSAAASTWVTFAREDLRMAELALGEGIWNQVCFHAEQCVEKLLKALLADQGVSIPQVHRLADLLSRLNPTSIALLAPMEADIRSLDRFYIPTRYPDALPGTLPSGLPGEPEANDALAVARNVAAMVDR